MFRFTIRELLLLTVIVGMGCGWLVTWKQWQRRWVMEHLEVIGWREKYLWERERASVLQERYEPETLKQQP